MSEKITAAAIRAAMLRQFNTQAWACFFEVRNATGFKGERSADALVMSLWPSQGLHLYGYEIKVSRSDWQNERRMPQKAETIATYCDFWNIMAAPKVVHDVSEVPEGWGLVEWDGKKFRTIKRAPQRFEPTPIDRYFLASILRSAGKLDSKVVDEAVQSKLAPIRTEMEERYQKSVDQTGTRYRDELLALQTKVKEFEEASGITLGDRWTSGKDLGEAVRAVKTAGIFETYGGLAMLSTTLRESADRLDKAGAGLGMKRPRRTTSDGRIL